MRSAAFFFLGALTLTSCRKHPPPPPPPAIATVPAAVGVVPGVVPDATPLPIAPASTYRYVQAVGTTNLSVLISVDNESHSAPRESAGVPLPPGMTARTTYMVVNLADGCVVSTDSFPIVDEAAQQSSIAPPLNGPSRVLPIVNSPVFHEQFVRKQKLFADYDENNDHVSAWSADGKRVLFAADDQMYRSDDGIRFSAIDVNASYVPKVSRDGRVGLYRRCSHPCGGGYRLAQIALDHPSSPRFVVGPEMHDFAFDPGETSVVYARENKTAKTFCIERLDLIHGNIISLACEPTYSSFSESILSISDDASFGALQTYDAPPTSGHLIVYDLRTGVRVRSIDASANVPPIDDEGRIALAVSGTLNARVSKGTEMQDAGPGEPLIWDHQKRLVLLHREALTTTPKCGVVSVIDLPY
jgi:hypothetical protein